MKTDAALSAAWTTIEAASAIALLAVVAGGRPWRSPSSAAPFTASRRDLRLLLVPVFAFLAIVLYGIFLASVANGWLHHPGRRPDRIAG